MEVKEHEIGELLIEGKTKQVFKLKRPAGDDGNRLVYILSKDRITAGDGAKAHDLAGKSKLSTKTNCAIFEFLNAVGVSTHLVAPCSSDERAFIAKECGMIPIEWVTRRVATGSYLRRHPNVKEGYRFAPPKLETFFKDDANHDPFWSLETLIEARLVVNGLLIEAQHVEEMLRVTQLVFELLERVWAIHDHALIDMKIEFGVVTNTQTGQKTIVVADCIDNDSWRLWPSGDKRLMLDKQIYRNLNTDEINQDALDKVKQAFQLVADRTEKIFGSVARSSSATSLCGPQVGIILGSLTDMEHAKKIKAALAHQYSINQVEIHVCSAHKSTEFALSVLAQLSQWPNCQVVIACAGRSNGLGPVASANTPIPVINCPPFSDIPSLSLDIWSSLRLPSGLGSPTIVGPDNAALAAAQIIGNKSPLVWSKIRTKQVYTVVKMIHDDKALNQ